MQGEEKLKGCDIRVLNLVATLEDMATSRGTDLIVTSGSRTGKGRSWHNKGLAVDWYFKDSNVFKYISEIYMLCLKQEGAFKGVTEIEVCRGVVKRSGKYYQWQHIHLAFGKESLLESFTGTYPTE